MANWDRIEKLMEHLRVLPSKKFNMASFFLCEDREVYGRAFNVGKVRKVRTDKTHSCKTTACLAGEACLLFLPSNANVNFWNERIETKKFGREDPGVAAARLLGLSDVEQDHMFYGAWSPNGYGATKAEAVKYLRKVLRSRDVMVSI